MSFLSTNEKTGQSYDFGICPMMKKVADKYKATCGVEKCYAAQLLNGHRAKKIRPKFEIGLRKEIQNMPKEVAIANATAGFEENPLIRGFSFADYIPEKKEEFLHIVRTINYRHIVISKTLWLFGDRELIKEVGEKTTLSLGFTKKLYPKFKKFYEANKDLKFSVAYTINNVDELKWLAKKDPELLAEIDVLHTSETHFKMPRLNNKGYTKAMLNHLKEIEEVSPVLRMKLCNMYGEKELNKKGCKDCSGCAQISRAR